MCSGCETVTRELVAPAYFSACLRRSLVTLTASAVSTCVGDRLAAAYTSSNCSSIDSYTVEWTSKKNE